MRLMRALSSRRRLDGCVATVKLPRFERNAGFFPCDRLSVRQAQGQQGSGSARLRVRVTMDSACARSCLRYNDGPGLRCKDGLLPGTCLTGGGRKITFFETRCIGPDIRFGRYLGLLNAHS